MNRSPLNEMIDRKIGGIVRTALGAPICVHGRQLTICGECFPTMVQPAATRREMVEAQLLHQAAMFKAHVQRRASLFLRVSVWMEGDPWPADPHAPPR